ncbi:oxidoreductase [Enterobacter cloacae]|uniref:SDR family oxidoreductase n=1 Tax=Enterobacter cloacae TaxID=550 RepID=UPI000BA841F8|nr:SDR family oxidoreductase [Enterobacter cloacae]MDW3563480.1 SDR family oxidoreductase [Enterobacter cloacae]PAN76420.1 oxidoreductase [Enterobacter cloacae]WNJ09268.1 SDR family oxidoreductase [Enterobacter cloacae]
MELKGKVAIVTGASSGIGAATAKKLARHGVVVGLAARRMDRLQALVTEIKAAGGESLALEMDVTDQASVKEGVDILHKTYGHIDIAFNNAGLMPISDISQLKVDEWHRMVDVNIKGVLNTVSSILPIMQNQKSGHIINTSSIAGRKTFPGLGVYCATKHAVAAFTDILRMELSPKYNIRVTSLQPGAVESELFEHITDQDYRKQMEGLKEQMKFLRSEDIADSIIYVLQAPDHVDVAEMFIMPTEQPW